MGINEEINSKFNANYETDIITELDSIESPNIVARYINAGLLQNEAQVVVHHYLEGTGEEYDNEAVVLSPEVTIDTTIGSGYTTTVGSEVPAKYELVENPANATGTVTSERIDVYYYYRLKEPSITNEEINKTSNTVSIDNVNDTVSYTIEYKVTVDDYEGNATVVIVDTLPYEIDTGAAGTSLDGGTYDSTSRTITWNETINNIDTYTEGEAREITITKNTRSSVVDIDVTEENIVNEVRGHIELDTPEKDSPGVEDTAETAQEYKISVTVNKEWLDNNDEYGRRPEKLTLILKKATGEEVGRQEIDVAGGESSYTFTNLDRYDETGNEIEYTADEEVTAPDSLDDYSKVIGNIQETEENIKSITITNTIGDISAQIVVHHYLEGTGEEYDNEAVVLSPNVTIETTIGADYETQVSTQVEAKYELVSTPSNATGTVTSERIDVYYYYRLKEPSITNEEINKTSNTVSIDNVNDTVSYTIEYKVTVDDYEGNATVVIVDTLPYEIDTGASGTSLDGGEYDSTSRTITWNETINNIDTYTEGEAREITITKNIVVKYVDIDVTEENIVNEVRGHIELDTPEKDSPGVEDTAETAQEYKISVTVNKEWLDNNDEYGRRPEKLTLILKKATGEEVGRQEIDVAGGVNSYTFTNLDRYDETGNEIEYTADEEVTAPDSLDDYSKVIGNIQETEENIKKYNNNKYNRRYISTNSSTSLFRRNRRRI